MQTAEASCPLSIQNNYTCYTVIVCYSLLKMTRISEASSPLSIKNIYTCYTVIVCYSLLKMTGISEASSLLSIQNNYTCYTVIDCCMCVYTFKILYFKLYLCNLQCFQIYFSSYHCETALFIQVYIL